MSSLAVVSSGGSLRPSLGPTALAKRLSERVAAVRLAFAERFREVNAMTEREVMAAARSVAEVVQRARHHVERTKEALSSVDGRGGKGGGGGVGAAIARQTEEVHRYREDLATRIAGQQAIADRAEAHLRSIGKAALAVSTLSREAHILALNARIEAGRAGSAGRSFAVIASEMQRLAKQIGEANELIDELASNLSKDIPEIASGARAMRTSSETMSRSIEASIKEVERETRSLGEVVRGALSESDAATEQIIGASQEALSHLQFQDTVAQGLLRLDGWFFELQQELSRSAGLPVEVDAAPPPPLHEEIGGEKPIDSNQAGEVMLF